MMHARWKLTLVVLIAIVILNFIPWKNSRAFEQQSFPEAFAKSWGWPASAIATTSDDGIELIDASVVFEGSTVYRDVFSGNFPHISINSSFVIIDLIVATLLLCGAFAVGILLEKRGITKR